MFFVQTVVRYGKLVYNLCCMSKFLHLKDTVTIGVNDVDPFGKIRPGAVLGYFQDIATTHAEKLGIGYDAMKAQSLIWVMSRASFVVNRSPKLGEKLTVKTFPEKPANMRVDRDYYIVDKQNKPVILGSSRWCAVSFETHKIQRCAPLFANFKKHSYIDVKPYEDTNKQVYPISETVGANEVSEPMRFTVRVTDLDRNIHMNNAVYGDIVLNACGIERLKTSTIKRLDINYLSELLPDEEYSVYKADISNETVFEGVKNDGKVAFRALASWDSQA